MTQRMLLSLAHPDDEAFGSGGTIAHYVETGTEVYLICSTNGDVGTVDPQFMEGYATVAEMRLAELACAAEVLGFAEVFTFGYRDSGMKGTPDNDHPDSLVQADNEELVTRIVAIIRQVRPQVVVTFDPFGGYGHPDHIVMYEATTDAFHKAGDATYKPALGAAYQAQKLYYRTFPRGWLKLNNTLMPLFGKNPEKMGRNEDINLREIARRNYPIHARINYAPHKPIAEKARNCHASQLGGGGRPNLLQRLQQWVAPPIDHYMRAYPEAPDSLQEADLFDNVEVTK